MGAGGQKEKGMKQPKGSFRYFLSLCRCSLGGVRVRACAENETM